MLLFFLHIQPYAKYIDIHKHIGKTEFFVMFFLNVFLSLAYSTTILSELYVTIFKNVCKQSTLKTFSNKNKGEKYG